MVDGRVAEYGSHADLMRQNGGYAHMTSFDIKGSSRAASPQPQPLSEKSRRGTFVISPAAAVGEKEDEGHQPIEEEEEKEKEEVSEKNETGKARAVDLVTYSVVIQYMKVGYCRVLQFIIHAPQDLIALRKDVYCLYVRPCF